MTLHEKLDLAAQFLQAVAILAVVWSAYEQRQERRIIDPTDPKGKDDSSRTT